ncbi:cytidine deaminase-like protein [Stachybotrys elegans]|uniref:Cytidine deaminase-like protein n=1 Tax=Stachybotrys elegans TaxID=80388 RepID=A0A8K0SE80_9HYPO|nr:cytidine deaminase-like protein [Stachybotrys elegans]
MAQVLLPGPKPPASPSISNLVSTILKVTEDDIVPTLRESGKAGNMPFGAAILSKSNLQPVAVAANNFRKSPLLHGETNCIREFFEIDASKRPDTKDCIFIATHEPCSLCLSGIAWTSFPTVYYLFTYQETHDQLGVGKDIRILEEIFRVPAPSDTEESLRNRPLYNETNKLFTIKPIKQLISEITDEAGKKLAESEMERVKRLWEDLRHGV